ncbi:UNVERIFIED_CONTAM: hypothetical protein K2H54_047175 [Gekko kuhli]
MVTVIGGGGGVMRRCEGRPELSGQRPPSVAVRPCAKDKKKDLEESLCRSKGPCRLRRCQQRARDAPRQGRSTTGSVTAEERAKPDGYLGKYTQGPLDFTCDMAKALFDQPQQVIVHMI